VVDWAFLVAAVDCSTSSWQSAVAKEGRQESSMTKEQATTVFPEAMVPGVVAVESVTPRFEVELEVVEEVLVEAKKKRQPSKSGQSVLQEITLVRPPSGNVAVARRFREVDAAGAAGAKAFDVEAVD
jgi:hypothetical protein